MRLLYLSLLAGISYSSIGPGALSAQETPAARVDTTGLGEIRGRVLAAESGRPLASAAVSVRSSRGDTLALVLTASDGRFRLGPLPPGRYLLRASRIGYAATGPLVVVLATAPPALELSPIRLAPAPVALRRLDVRARRTVAPDASGRIVYSTADMAAAVGGSVADLLREIPELEVDARGTLKLRGSTGVALHIDGRRSPLTGEALQTFLRQLPALRVDRIEVVPNPSAAADAEGAAGIVDIVLKRGDDAGGRLSAHAGYRSDGLSGSAGRRLGPAQWRASAALGEVRSSSQLHDLRQNLLARPVTTLAQDGGSSDRTRGGSLDVSTDVRLGRATTLTTSVSAGAWSYHGDGRMLYALTDTQRAALACYHRDGAGTSRRGRGEVVVGLRHAYEPTRHELSLEVRAAAGADTLDSRYVHLPVDPVGALGVVDEVRYDHGYGYHRLLSLQADYRRPVGRSGRLQVGVRDLLRRNASDHALAVSDPLQPSALAAVSGGYTYDEGFASAYATLGGGRGRTTLEGGLRLEREDRRFLVRSSGEWYDRVHLDAFPSASLALDLGRGRQARLAYSRRVARPEAYRLDPDVPELDVLNRVIGNPLLQPEYTHLVSAELGNSGPHGSLRFSPYYRRAVGDWDQVKRVDSLGVATVTWENVPHTDAYGASLTGTLTGPRVSGFASVGAFREQQHTEATLSDVAGGAWRMTGSVNATVRPTRSLSAYGSLAYSPARQIPQGRISGTLLSTLALRRRLSDRTQVSVSTTDPFGLWHYSFETRDGTHAQTSRDDYSVRNAVLVLQYAFGGASRPAEPENEPGERPELRIH